MLGGGLLGSCCHGQTRPAATPDAAPPEVEVVSSKTVRDRDLKKKQLQELVQRFTREAHEGVGCTVVEPDQGVTKMEALYTLDASVTCLRFVRKSDRSVCAALTTASIDRVCGFDSLHTDEQQALSRVLPKWLVGSVVLLKSAPARSSASKAASAAAATVPATEVYLLFEDKRERERFITCIEILRTYCKAEASAKRK
eukprot:gnl/TRDRNA2_/TRDRNA2_191361_c0_seq1.p1 gnl/TRDRNA2_/TRDRNA2_191361_c0~~gnl/TRDRNA2_/TRDRNA2_191361_c0_seq1.p1  ORF type:complete len:198 (+),score=41.83 gnl/TRDRNA2_/TRDRNA2_191361_c0_seq1:49-642(+)